MCVAPFLGGETLSHIVPLELEGHSRVYFNTELILFWLYTDLCVQNHKDNIANIER